MKMYHIIRNHALSPVDERSKNATGVYLAKDVHAFRRKLIRWKRVFEIIWAAAIGALSYFVIVTVQWPF